MKEFLAVTNALADESRVRALMALRGGELCACQIIALLKLAPSTVSRHMALLHQAGLVEFRKKGTWIHYRLAQSDMLEARTWVFRALAHDPKIAEDKNQLKHIAKTNLDALCKKIRQRKSAL